MKDKIMSIPLLIYRIVIILVFVICYSTEIHSQESNVIYGSYDTLDKDKQLVRLLNKLPAYDSAKVKFSILSSFENRISKKYLDYSLYLPKDSFQLHPLVIFMNGGGLLFSEKDENTMKLLGEKLSDEGIAFMAIEYRTEVLTLLSVNQAGYLAIQDFHEAIKYAKDNAGGFKISPDHIYIGGIGCGAVSALHTAALEEDELEYAQFSFYDKKHGCLNCRGKSKSDSEVKGVINISGGVIDLEILKDEDFKLLQFYGEDDKIISCEIAKPYYELIENSLDFTDYKGKIAGAICEFMDMPTLCGALTIEKGKDGYPDMSIKTVSFPKYGHRLLVSDDYNQPMTTTHTILKEMFSFVKSDLKSEVKTMIMPSKAQTGKNVVLKGPNEARTRWYVDDEIIYEGKERKIDYRFENEGEKVIGLSVQNKFGIWSDIKEKPIEIVLKLTLLDRLKRDYKEMMPWVVMLLIIGLICLIIYKAKKDYH